MKSNRTSSFLASVALALACSACSGQEGEQETVREMAPAPEPPPAARNAPKPLPPSASDSLANVDPEALRLVAEAHREKLKQKALGARIEIVADGAPIELPEDYPVDVPLHPTGSPTRYVASKAGGAMTELEIPESSHSVRNFYVQEMASEGWLIENDSSLAGLTIVSGTKDGRELAVTIRDNAGVSQVVVVESY